MISQQQKLMLLDLFADLNIDGLYDLKEFDNLAKITQYRLIDYFDTNKDIASPGEAKTEFESILAGDEAHAAEQAGQMRLFGISSRDVIGLNKKADGADEYRALLNKARALGREAFHNGIKCVPAWDPQMIRFIKEYSLGDTLALLKEWLNGWHEENLKPDSNFIAKGALGLNKKASTSFDNWIDTFISEKGIDLEETFEAEGPEWGVNIIPYGVVVEHMKIAPQSEQAAIKNMIIRIDFKNLDVKDYFRHLGKALAR